MSFSDHEGHGAAAASRVIERKLAEAVGVEVDAEPATLAELVEEIRAQLKTIDEKMAAGFRLAAQRIDSIESRLDVIERFIHVPPDLVSALKSGGQPG